MSNLLIFNESFTNGLFYNLLNIISVTSVLCGIFVIISKNPIVSVLFLIGLFLNIAGYLMMLGINFIGLSYLLVYVGAVSILFLFILMLINVRISELVTDSSNSVPLAIMIGIFFFVTLYKLLPSNINIPTSFSVHNMNKNFSFNNNSLNKENYIYYPLENFYSNFTSKVVGSNNIELSYATSQIWDGRLAESSHITTIGSIIYTNYPMWLLLTSIILLLAMVGAIIITIKK
jgi:NADH-ubiquinone oxidoreductase chain 6